MEVKRRVKRAQTRERGPPSAPAEILNCFHMSNVPIYTLVNLGHCDIINGTFEQRYHAGLQLFVFLFLCSFHCLPFSVPPFFYSPCFVLFDNTISFSLAHLFCSIANSLSSISISHSLFLFMISIYSASAFSSWRKPHPHTAHSHLTTYTVIFNLTKIMIY